MPFMVTIMGRGTRRAAPLTQAELNAKAGGGQLVGGCPQCTEGRVAVFQPDATRSNAMSAVLQTSDLLEMYIVSFSGSTPAVATENGKAWMNAEVTWLNQTDMSIRTFTY